jgi:Cu/Ag efflux protein CusF
LINSYSNQRPVPYLQAEKAAALGHFIFDQRVGLVLTTRRIGPPRFQLKEETAMIRLPHCLGIALALAMFLGLVASAQAAEEVKGKIKKITPDKMEFVLTDKDGKDFEFKVEETAKIQLNDKNTKFEELKENDEVTVKYDKKGEKFTATEIKAERK